MDLAVEDVLFPVVDVELERLSPSLGIVTVEVAARGGPPRGPDCSFRGTRVHSSYWRTLAERPQTGRTLVIRLRVRRCFCDRARCRRRTFVEQVQGLSERHRRASLRLKAWLRAVAVKPGGWAGERLCRAINVRAGRTRLLGLLEAPTVPARVPRVLGVDEFAFRRGRAYGTVLVDIEAGRVVDVLPDRTSETFAAWLREHPGVEIVCRDRASAYTKAVKEAAPDAIEVAGSIARSATNRNPRTVTTTVVTSREFTRALIPQGDIHTKRHSHTATEDYRAPTAPTGSSGHADEPGFTLNVGLGR